MSSKVASFFGESLSEVVFARKTELEENVDNWYAYLFSVVEKERKDLFYTMLENDGKIYPKNLVKFRNKFNDALGWLWINVFVAGDRDITTGNFSQNYESVAEFDKKKESEVEKLLREAIERGDKTIKYIDIDTGKLKNYTLEEWRKTFMDDTPVVKSTITRKTKRTPKKGEPLPEKLQQQVTSVEKAVATDQEILERIRKNKRGVFDTSSTRDNDEQKALKAVRNLQTLTKEQSTASAFMQESDFGRIYVQQRRDYIANVYTDKTEKENMLSVFNQMNKQYEEGNASPPIQKYFERRYMRKDPQTGNVTIGNVGLETEPPIKIGGVTLAGKRKSPTPYKNNDPLRELKLYEDVRKNMGKTISDGRLRNIVKTEVVAAYNMGRLHQMYIGQVKFVRWVNDVENRKEGKVCQICTIRAMGTSESLRRFAQKESLSGIYTIEDAFTNRQLAIPSHVNCLCQLRPINPEEEKVLVAAGVFQTNMADTAAVIGGIAGAGLEGATNTQIAKEGTDRSQWWYGALAAGGAAVAIGAMMWYLRKSLVSKYAADITKKRGVEAVETLNRRSGRLGEIAPPNQQTLEDSLRIKDDLPNIVDGADINASNVKPEKYNKKLLKRFPELGTPLPDLGELTQDLRGEAEDLLWTNAVDNVLVQRTGQAFKDSAISDKTLKIQLKELGAGLIKRNEQLQEQYTQDNPLNPVLARTIVDTEKNIQTVNKLLSEIDTRKTQLPNTILSQAEIKDVFEDLKPIKIDTQGLKMNVIAGETFTTKVKEVTVDVAKRYADNGVVDADIVRLTEMLTGLDNRQTIPFSDFQRINKQLRRIERERAFADLAVTRGNVNLFAEIQNFMENALPDALSPKTRNIYNKNLAHKNLLREVSNKLNELKVNTPTYKQKLIDENITDPFIGEITRTQSAKSVKNLALKKRTQSISTLEEYIKLVGKKNTQDTTVKLVARRLLEIVEKVEPDSAEDFVETFISSNTKERVKLLRKYRDKLISETRRIRDVEFTRYQQKWAMFGSPK